MDFFRKFHCLINDGNEGEKVNVELVGALYQLYKVKKEELGEAKTLAVPNVKQTQNEVKKV